jgi:hypothetical protein
LRWDPKGTKVIAHIADICVIHQVAMLEWILMNTVGFKRYWKSLPLSFVMNAVFIMVGASIFFAVQTSGFLKASEFADLLNTLQTYQTNVIARNTSLRSTKKYEVFQKFLMVLATISGFAFPLIPLEYLAEPCFIPYLGTSLLLNDQGVCEPSGFGVHFIFMIFEMWLDVTLCVMAIFVCIDVFCLTVNFFLDAQSRLEAW